MLRAYRRCSRPSRLVTQDWEKTIAECDSPDTLFFIDPPYEGEWSLSDGIPAEEIAKAVSKIKGQFVVAYTDSVDAGKALGTVGRPFRMRSRGAGQWQKRSRLFVASFKVQKHDEIEWLDDRAVDGNALVAAALQKRIPLLKTSEKRYVLGIVLEPECVDASRTPGSASAVRRSAQAPRPRNARATAFSSIPEAKERS